MSRLVAELEHGTPLPPPPPPARGEMAATMAPTVALAVDNRDVFISPSSMENYNCLLLLTLRGRMPCILFFSILVT